MKSIFLVNPISGRGHLDSYARLYSRALLELGYRVVLLAEADGGTTDYLSRNSPASMSSFSFVSFEQAQSFALPGSPIPPPDQSGPSARSQMNMVRRAFVVWQDEGARGIMGRCVRVPHRILLRLIPSPLRRPVRRVEGAIWRRFLQTRLARALKLPTDFEVGRLMFSPWTECIDKIAPMLGNPAPDLVFFLYLDIMAQWERNVAVLDRPGAPPWTGILFHPLLARMQDGELEGYFKSKTARGGVFLVPNAISAYAEATPHLHFALVPDVADLELLAEPSELAREIRRRAGDRTIVLQIGSITAHKGIPTLLDVIATADPGRYFFALIGEVHWATFKKDKRRIKSFYARPPENVHLSQGYMQSEREYNTLIAASDIVYAAYWGFSSSSNSLTKAAGLSRPILVSENSLMGERVHHFNIGATAPEGDAKAILEKLYWLSKQPKNGFGFAAFSQEQSLDALKRPLAEALPNWITEPATATLDLPRDH
jgi:hypothetical protein